MLIKIKNASDVVVNLMLRARYKRKYNTINIGDEIRIFTKGKGNYTSRKETASRWSSDTYKVKYIGYDITSNKYYVLQGLQRHFLRHELLLINGVMTIRKREIIIYIISFIIII